MDYSKIAIDMLPIVCERLGVNASANVRVVVDDQFDSTLAYCKFISPGNYDIVYHSEQTDVLKIICHELVHIVQHLRGDVFRIDLPYREQPHEIEAYGLEDELVSLYYSSFDVNRPCTPKGG